MASFEETNNPGYDEVFREHHSKENSLNNSYKKRKISELLENDLLITVLHLVDNGAELTNSQEKLLKKKFIERVNQRFDIIENLFSQNIKFDEKYIGLSIIYNIGSFQETFNILNHPEYEERAKYNRNHKFLFNQYVQEKHKNDTLSPLLFKAWKETLNDIVTGDAHYLNKEDNNRNIYLRPEDFLNQRIINPVNQLKQYLFQSVEEKEYNECINIIKKVGSKLNLNELCDSFAGKLKREKLYIQDIKSSVKEKENLANLIKDKQESDFPSDARDALMNIIRIYGEINENKDVLNAEQKFNVNNLYHDKLPEIVSNYLSISPTYKNKLVGSTKSNVNSAFTEIINDVKDIFENTLMSINKNKINDLAVSKEYFSQIKKGM